MSKKEKLLKQQEKLEAKLEKKKADLKLAQERVRALEAELAEADGGADAAVSPFAPKAFPELPVVAGVRLAAAEAGVRYSGRLDVMLAHIAKGASVAGVFTRSRTRAAPVLWCQEKLAKLQEKGGDGPFAILVNAGNANAFTGDNGWKGVETTAKAAAKAAKVKADHVFVASTGVIGEPLPAERITAKLDDLAADLSATGWTPAARAIMTTDTFPKGASAEVEIGGVTVRVAGFCKGSGMIAPDMATMLGFVFTDADVAPAALQKLTAELADESFNAITVDGDTSTSDTVLVAATGKSGAPRIENGRSAGYAALRKALGAVLADLAQQIVKDGEGATKFVTVKVEGAKTARAARVIGLAIGNSPLVKTAWAGEDPNWGRLIAAIGKAGEEADRDRLSISYGPYPVASNGWRSPDYDEQTLAAYMKNGELEITVNVGVGEGSATIWTCDLTHRYIEINADYRS